MYHVRKLLPQLAQTAQVVTQQYGLQFKRKFSLPAVQQLAGSMVGRYTLGVGTAGGAAALVVEPDNLQLAYLVPSRLARDIYAAVSIVYDYKRTLRDPSLQGEAREAALAACHQRSADKLMELCFKNGGIYIKLGQHIGQLDHLLPKQYVVTMRQHLLDKCPASSMEEVRQIFMQDFGRAPEAIFASFEPTPVASASLAQVHVARDAQGRKLAVKVQHAGLRESSLADILTIETLVKAVKHLFPDFNYLWLVDEIKHNLPRELDFRHEAANAERCRANLDSPRSRVRGRVHVPHIHHDLTSHRVLTMEFVEGAGITDTAALARMGVNLQELARLVSQTFSQMIFMHGDVHCDPHAANMLVRKDARGRVQLVLLDHGLYRQIDDEFRMQYAGLWHSLIFADEQGIKRHSEAMNAGDMYPLFAALLTQLPWDKIMDKDMDHLTIPTTSDHKSKVQGYAAQYAREITTLLLRMPRPLLLLLKTNDCLRSVDNCLGQPVNTFVITARECTRALAEARIGKDRNSLLTRLAVAGDMFAVETRMMAFRWMMWYAWMRGSRSAGAETEAAPTDGQLAPAKASEVEGAAKAA